MNIEFQRLNAFHYQILKKIIAEIKRHTKEKNQKKRKFIIREIFLQSSGNFNQKIPRGVTLTCGIFNDFCGFSSMRRIRIHRL